MALERPRRFGDYVLLKALGKGAMGDVYLARPLNLERGIPSPVVIKRLHLELSNRKGFIARFRHEAAIAVSVNSAHVAKVYDVGTVGDMLYIVMEYVAGWPLSTVLDSIVKSGQHASMASVLDLIAGGLDGLHALHVATDPQTQKDLGIVHRDISPKNLMVGEDGVMRLIDLGLGKSNVQDWKTRTGVVMGSVGYMPPEQARGERVDRRADVYSMGVVAFEMLALRNYIKRGPLPKMMEASANPKFMRPSDFRPDVPQGLDKVIQKALDPDRDARYQTAREFLTALRTIVPARHTAGGMVQLLDDLFGEGKRARQRELEMLLKINLPEDEPEPQEPTEVFVLGVGVTPPDKQTTQYAPKPDLSALPRRGASEEPTEATEVVEGVGEGVAEPMVKPVSSGTNRNVANRRTSTISMGPEGPPGASYPHPMGSYPAGPNAWGQLGSNQLPLSPTGPPMQYAQQRGTSPLVVALIAVLSSFFGVVVTLFATGVISLNTGGASAETEDVPAVSAAEPNPGAIRNPGAKQNPQPGADQRERPAEESPSTRLVKPPRRRTKRKPPPSKPPPRASRAVEKPAEPAGMTPVAFNKYLGALRSRADRLRKTNPEAAQNAMGLMLDISRLQKAAKARASQNGGKIAAADIAKAKTLAGRLEKISVL